MQSDSQGWAKSRLDSFIASNAELKSAGQAGFKPKKDKEKKEKKEPPKLSEFKKWIKELDPKESLPLIAPGRVLRINSLVGPKGKPKGLGFVEKKEPITKNMNDIALSVKGILGPDIGDLPNGASILARVARAMGNLWVDDQNKLRCPAGTPAANQFTNLQMTNCMVPSARTVASDVLDIAAGPSKNQARALLSGRMAAIDPNDRIQEPDGQGGALWKIGSKEKARRVTAWIGRQKTKQDALRARYGILQTPKQLKKAIADTFPNINRRALDEIFADRPELTPEEYLKWLAYREGILKSMLYEAMMNPELADIPLILKINNDLDAAMEASIVDADSTVAMSTSLGDMPFGVAWVLEFNPREIAATIDNQDPDHRSVPFGTGKDGTFTALEAGLYDGTHETLGHLGHFINALQRLGIDTKDMDMRKAYDALMQRGTPLTEDEKKFVGLMQDFQNNLNNGVSLENAYQELTGGIAAIAIENIGSWNDDVLESMRKMLGTNYGQTLNVETRAEVAVLLRDMPELVQEWIDKENLERTAKGLPPLPNVDELMRDGYGKDVVPNTAITRDSEEARPRNIGASIRRFFGSLRDGDEKPFDANNPDDIDELVNAVETLEQNRIEKIEKETKDEALDILFRYYTPEEAQKYFDLLEQYGARVDSELAIRLLPVPEIFEAHRSPSGMKTSEEVEWEMTRNIGLGGTEWLDADEIEARRILYGNEGFARTVRRAAGRTNKKIQERVKEIQKSRDAKKQTRKLAGKMSQDRNRLKFSKDIEKMIDDPARPKIRTISSGKGKRVVQQGNTVDPRWMTRLTDDQLLEEIDAMENRVGEDELMQRLSPRGQQARRQMLDELNKERIRRKLRRRWRRTERDEEARDKDRNRGRDGRRRRNSARQIIEDAGGEPEDPITAEIRKRNSEPRRGQLSGQMAGRSPAEIRSKNAEILGGIERTGGNFELDEDYVEEQKAMFESGPLSYFKELKFAPIKSKKEITQERKARNRQLVEQLVDAAKGGRGKISKTPAELLLIGEIDSDGTTGPSYGQFSDELIEYLATTPVDQILEDLEATALEFAAGIDKRPRVNIASTKVKRLISAGRYFTTHQTEEKLDGRTSTLSLPDTRLPYEASVGISATTPAELRPASGYMVHRDWENAEKSRLTSSGRNRPGFDVENLVAMGTATGTVHVYGNSQIILKEEVGERSLYGLGDTLSDAVTPTRLDSTDPDEILNALVNLKGMLDPDGKTMTAILELLGGRLSGDYSTNRTHSRSQYLEALIMGSFDLEDVEEIKMTELPLPSSFFKQNDDNEMTQADRVNGLKQLINENLSMEGLVSLGATQEEAEEIITEISQMIQRLENMVSDPEQITVNTDFGVLSTYSSFRELLHAISATELRDMLSSMGIRFRSSVGDTGTDPSTREFYTEEELSTGLSPVQLAASRFRKQLIKTHRNMKEVRQMRQSGESVV